MIPILYAAGTTSFTSNGLGRLAELTSCIVTEERNGQYELEAKYPITGLHYGDIAISNIIFAEPADGKTGQPFSIYSIGKPINGIVTIKAEHISYQLSHIPVEPFETTTIGGAFSRFSTDAAENNPFTFWTDKTTTGNFTVKVPSSIRSLLGGVQGSILDVYGGGEYEFDKYTVKLHQNRGNDRGVTLRYGKNITDIKQEENISNTYTGVMPYWADSEGVIVMLTERVLHSENAANFPYQRTIPLDLSSEFSEEPTETQLRTKAQAYMAANNIGVPHINISVSFVALWQTEEYKDIANLERVNLCDTVTVEFPALDISATAKVVKTVYNVLKNKYDSIELGEARTNLARQISQDLDDAAKSIASSVPTKSYMERAIEAATDLIRGGLGGYVVINTNANGEPQEILIMDDDDIQTAVDVIRINKNGIGFSSTGYEGPFTSAWTIDGHFVADFITTGNINASLITTGTLLASLITSGKIESNNGRVYFDLDNNEIVCSQLKASTPWTVSGQSDPGDVIIDIARIDRGQGYSPRWLSYATIYKYGYKDYGLVIEPPKETDGKTCINSKKQLVIYNGPNYYNRKATLWFSYSNSDNDFGLTNYNGAGIYSSGSDVGVSGTLEATAINTVSLNTTGSKHRNVTTDNYGRRLLSSYETAAPMFGDVGQGRTDESGICVVDIDDMLLETIGTETEYQVFLQKEGPGDLYVSEKNYNHFIVEGTANLSFAWELKAIQRDFALDRLESGEKNSDETDEMILNRFDWSLEDLLMECEDISWAYDDEIMDFIEEQEVMLYETA